MNMIVGRGRLCLSISCLVLVIKFLKLRAIFAVAMHFLKSDLLNMG